MSEEDKHPGGRPSKLTPMTLDRLCYAIRIGASYEHAAAYAGIDRVTFYRWRTIADGLAKGDVEEADRAEFVEFCNALKSAEAEGAVGLLESIAAAAGADPGGDVPAEHMTRTTRGDRSQWQAGAWILERRWPEMYGKREKVEMQHGGEVKVTATGDMAAALAAAAKGVFPG